jgi:hypothetical protein
MLIAFGHTSQAETPLKVYTDNMTRQTFLPLLLVVAILPACITGACAKRKPEGSSQFDRNQIMLINLDKGQASTSAYLKDSLDATKQTIKELDKGLHQLEQVDKSYAKSRGRPDDSYLSAPAEEIKAAQKSAQDLEAQLKAASEDLKDTIQQTLAREDAGRNK